jgi:hypothetical protein
MVKAKKEKKRGIAIPVAGCNLSQKLWKKGSH